MNNEHPMRNDSAMDTEHPFSTATPVSMAIPAKTNIASGAVAAAEEIAPQDVKQHRGIGVLMLFVGLATGYGWVYRPLQDAADGVSSLSVSMKMTAITPFILVYGVTLLLFPKFVLRHMGGYGSGKPKSAFGWIYLVALIALGFAFWFWMQAQYRTYGYNV